MFLLLCVGVIVLSAILAAVGVSATYDVVKPPAQDIEVIDIPGSVLPGEVIPGGGDPFQEVEDESGQRVEILFAFVHPFGAFEFG
ncbi:MAG: hypothetical protein ACK5VH_11010 [bacterium]